MSWKKVPTTVFLWSGTLSSHTWADGNSSCFPSKVRTLTLSILWGASWLYLINACINLLSLLPLLCSWYRRHNIVRWLFLNARCFLKERFCYCALLRQRGQVQVYFEVLFKRMTQLNAPCVLLERFIINIHLSLWNAIKTTCCPLRINDANSRMISQVVRALQCLCWD